jgi:hypothetical protein
MRGLVSFLCESQEDLCTRAASVEAGLGRLWNVYSASCNVLSYFISDSVYCEGQELVAG